MKILAIVDVTPGASMERIRAEIKNEIAGSWKLFSSGVLREAYSTAAPSRVVFILEADDMAQATAHLRELPLVAAGLLSLELVELRPFVNWSMLFSDSGR
jgi:hypothetical protein